MTKKRIADLLKEEVEKTNDTEQPQEKSQSHPSQPPANSDEDVAPKNTAGTSRTRKRTTKASATATTKTAEASSTNALKKQVTELEKSLKQAQAQITELQDDIKTHQTRIFELKDELSTAQKNTADKSDELTKVIDELETAKETIRKITTQQAETPAQPKDTAQKIVHGADLATNRNTLSLRNRPSSYKSIPEYAIQRGEQNSMLSDDDIGWVD